MRKKHPKTEKNKKGAGRPRTPVDYDRVEALAARGMDKKDIAACLGITMRTLNQWEIDDPKFDRAMEKGQAAGIAAVTGQLLKAINLGNMTGIIFYLKCRGKWKETTIIETREAAIVIDDDCTPEEAEAAYIASMRTIK